MLLEEILPFMRNGAIATRDIENYPYLFSIYKNIDGCDRLKCTDKNNNNGYDPKLHVQDLFCDKWIVIRYGV